VKLDPSLKPRRNSLAVPCVLCVIMWHGNMEKLPKTAKKLSKNCQTVAVIPVYKKQANPV